MFDTHTNLALVTITVAPSPATSGTTLSVSNTDAAMIADPDGAGNTDYNATVFPTGSQPTQTNAEIVRVTAKGAADSGGSGNTQFTITRTQEGTSTRTIVVGDKLIVAATKKVFTDIEQSLGDGWTPATDTWVYATASTFTIAGVDRTAIYAKGTRLKFTQSSTVKYAVVVSSSFSTNTTVTIAVNNDYTIANAAITNPFYSYQVSPQGYPATFFYTPTFTGFSSSPAGAQMARFAVVGTICTVFKRPDTGNGTSNAGGFSMTAPITSRALSTSNFAGWCPIRPLDSGAVPSALGDAYILPSSSTIVLSKTPGNSGSWTSSGLKDADFVLMYEI